MKICCSNQAKPASGTQIACGSAGVITALALTALAVFALHGSLVSGSPFLGISAKLGSAPGGGLLAGLAGAYGAVTLGLLLLRGTKPPLDAEEEESTGGGLGAPTAPPVAQPRQGTHVTINKSEE